MMPLRLRRFSLLHTLITLGAVAALATPALARGGGEGRGRGDDRESWPQEECESAYGKTVCGYACVAAYGDVQCAAVPWGACEAAYGKVVCGPDGGPRPRRWREMPRATCTAAYGDIACGYGCVAAYGVVRCAATPTGHCEAAYGKVTCIDGGGRRGPQATCKSAYGQTACGYDCVAAYGEVRCASSPSGRCVAEYGRITCSD